jgi:hypothetical protein
MFYAVSSPTEKTFQEITRNCYNDQKCAAKDKDMFQGAATFFAVSDDLRQRVSKVQGTLQ